MNDPLRVKLRELDWHFGQRANVSPGTALYKKSTVRIQELEAEIREMEQKRLVTTPYEAPLNVKTIHDMPVISRGTV